MIFFLFLIFYLFKYEISFLRNQYSGKDLYFTSTLKHMLLCLGFKKHCNIIFFKFNSLTFFEKKPVFSKFFYLLF